MNGMKITSPSSRPDRGAGRKPGQHHRASEVTRAFTGNLTPAPDPERADTVLLLVSELATNALRHGGGRYTLQLFAGPDTLIAAVDNLSSAAPRDRTPDLNGGSGGFGWHMIRYLPSHLTITPAPGKAIRSQLPR
ncbi:ATP-binding protein [Streptomyces sp. NPDC059008]|uniref:ATP-binding protein n=1 Tax=Streptomyces sp. NPDC059008 TaxID=3346693 RepID=UPI0036C743A8